MQSSRHQVIVPPLRIQWKKQRGQACQQYAATQKRETGYERCGRKGVADVRACTRQHCKHQRCQELRSIVARLAEAVTSRRKPGRIDLDGIRCQACYHSIEKG